MKAKYALIALLATTFLGCDDNTAGLGLGMFPGSDQDINGKLTSFDVITGSVPTGKIYAMTNIGYVGKFTDPIFGEYKAGFLATLNCPTGLTFPAVYEVTETNSQGVPTKAKGVMVTEEGDDITLIKDQNNNVIGNIHTVELYLWYNSYFGDSLTASRLSVYELEKKLDSKDSYFTDIDPEKYYNVQNPKVLGTKAYTAVDLSVKDSIRNLSTYVPSVHLNFSKEIASRVGGDILKQSRIAPLNKNVFSEIFKGLYVKSDYGDGTVLYVNLVQMNVVYKCYAVNDAGVKLKKKVAEKDGTTYKDSTYYTTRPFYSTREVIQANRLENDKNAIQKCIDDKECTYLKSPAGIFTQATLPIGKIKEDLAGDTLNAVKLTFSNYSQSNSNKKFGMSIPSTVMLIRERFKDSFFIKNLLADNVGSFLSTHTSNSNQYVFSNITKLVNACIADREVAEKELKEKGSANIRDEKGEPMKDSAGNVRTATSIEDWEKEAAWDKVVLIPVLVTYDSSSNGGYGYASNVISVQHDLKPGYVKLKGGLAGANSGGYSEAERNKYKLKLEVVSTSFTRSKE